ncbi:TPA: LOW QUALITY PROTEIN: hypothetical protein N0F65_008729 [Lagenidium giganteum]|uniref:HTH CENPB-type domain-containing protein n=1 Tax=Lagenidium giganteum TaxID=4803 RepID=A0AAV2YPZ0_9STRA|nr:TPA: LOW QUALITY PROTEIN: hypothetical protein N0F65_008729 [Lagenidium giganteum]
MRRTSIKGTKHVPLTHKYSTYSYAKKLAVINHFRDGGHIDATLSLFFSEVNAMRRESLRKSIYPSIDREDGITPLFGTPISPTLYGPRTRSLVEWVNNLRGEGLPVSSTMLHVQALTVSRQFDVPEGKVTASHVWQRRFLRQQNLAAAAEATAEFSQEVRTYMEANDISRLLNADQTAVFFELLPKRTISNRGTKTVWVKCGSREQQRATAMYYTRRSPIPPQSSCYMVLADASGIKFPLFLVFHTKQSTNPDMQQINVKGRHGFGVKVWNEVTELQDTLNVQIYGNGTAWWNSELTCQFLRSHFGARTPESPPWLLLLDSFSGHWTDAVEACAHKHNIHLMRIPPYLTWQAQPANVAWIKPRLTAQLANRPTGPFVLAAPKRRDVVEWMCAAWGRVSARTTICGFLKCGYADGTTELSATDQVHVNDDEQLVRAVQAPKDTGLLDQAFGEIADSMDVVDHDLQLTEHAV